MTGSGDYYEVLGIPQHLSPRQRQLYEQLRAEDAGIKSTAGRSGEPEAPRSGRRITAGPSGWHGAGRGLLIFTSILLLLTGIANLAGGIAAISGAQILIAGARSVSGGMPAWGWVMAILGAVQLATAGVWAARSMRSSSTAPP